MRDQENSRAIVGAWDAMAENIAERVAAKIKFMVNRHEEEPIVYDELVSTSEAAAITGVTTKTIRRWINEGRLAAVRHGRHFRVSRRSLMKARHVCTEKSAHDVAASIWNRKRGD